jgi:hypothetical protein
VARWSSPFALDAADFGLGGVRSTVVQRDLSRRAGYAVAHARACCFGMCQIATFVRQECSAGKYEYFCHGGRI